MRIFSKEEVEKTVQMFLEGYPYAEIAQELDIRVGTVSGIISNLRSAGADLPRRNEREIKVDYKGYLKKYVK